VLSRDEFHVHIPTVANAIAHMIRTFKREQQEKDEELRKLRDQLERCQTEIASHAADKLLLYCNGPVCNEEWICGNCRGQINRG